LTERDIPFDQVAYVSLFLLVPLTCVFAYFIGQSGVFSSLEQWGIAAAASVFTFVIGFVVATACGYMAGLIGSSNSPISGIAIIAVISAGLLLIVLLGRGLDQPEIQKQAIAIALFATAAVLAVATISNDNLQDLKTGQLVGATPARQQWALVIGSVVGSLVIPPILELVYQAYGFAGALPHEGMDPTKALGAPQATVMSALATGLLTGKLDWTMLTIGVGLGVVLIGIDIVLKRTTKTASLPPLAVGLGIYLPSAVSTPIALGAIIAWATDRQLKKRAAAAGQDFEAYAELPRRRGTLLASGLIVGESLVGVVLAALIVAADSQTPIALVGESFVPIADWLGGGVFLIVCWDIYRRVLKH
jgi:putative OPT family oligopeptide transporter